MMAARSPPRSDPANSHDFLPSALTRKNALFAGSDGGAEHWATIASLIETCKINDVNPLDYLADVITRIVNGHPNYRSAVALGLPKARTQSRGLRTTLTIQRNESTQKKQVAGRRLSDEAE
jgi:transposase IS66-like protein